MCWWCCMRVLEKCLPRNDIVRELAPYLQHVHQDDALDEETRRGGDMGGPWVRTQSPRGVDKDSATSSDSLRHVNANFPLRHSLDCELSLQNDNSLNQSRPLSKMSMRKPDAGYQDGNYHQDHASATFQKE
ncbi:hypothetical protein GN244_ATG17436 [Phytophthora infestans]|uniref:Uncharacterized protein n=1 Tax=Phytophthora infestans TaxID=4787 RepID=A0A833WL57_PHYIN|nr:hypothetical protein GN244_ATG17436 [Phytophthora infestans]